MKLKGKNNVLSLTKLETVNLTNLAGAISAAIEFKAKQYYKKHEDQAIFGQLVMNLVLDLVPEVDRIDFFVEGKKK